MNLTSLPKIILRLYLFLIILGIIKILTPDVFLFNTYLKSSLVIDIFVLNFSIVFVFYKLYREIILNGIPRSHSDKNVITYSSYLLLASLYFFGTSYGIYYISNLIDDYLTTHDPLVYFYDEILGHTLIYMSVAIAVLALTILQFYYPSREEMTRNDVLIFSILSVPMSLFAGYSVIEGQSVPLGYIASISYLIITFVFSRYFKLDLRRCPFVLLTLFFSIGLFFVLSIYGIVFNGWPQPSTFN